MNTVRRAALALCVCVFAAGLGHAGDAAAGNFDGKWTGTIGSWKVSLDVSGAKGKLVLVSCNGGTSEFTVDVTSEGKIDAWLKDLGTSRRHIEGQLPNFMIPPSGGRCSGGTGALIRQ